MIDEQGFRPGVAMVILSERGHVFWARRIGHDAWQFPQGGISEGEEPIDALYREIYEEIGLEREDIDVIGETNDWLYYHLPENFIRREQTPLCIGQKQKWFLLKLKCSEQKIRLDLSDTPEFDSWRWVKYWHPQRHVIAFKRDIYEKALKELRPFIEKDR